MDREVLNELDNVVPLHGIPVTPGHVADQSEATVRNSLDDQWQPNGCGADHASVFCAAEDTTERGDEVSLDLLDLVDVADRYGLPRAVPFSDEALNVVDPNVDVCDHAVTNIQVGLLYRHLRALPEAEAKVLRLVYGLGDEGPLTDHEIAAEMKTSVTEVRQLARSAVASLRELYGVTDPKAA